MAARAFAELVGQEHVVTALTNALTRGRLHHAYLLTGTRGVGKTTLARILAKSLNCETAASPRRRAASAPRARDIDAGRFVDLLELDAASNTGIDNMREILDNARYAPTVGRYKVYLIDEVHMLSKARVQLDAEDARGAARARQVRARDDRPAEDSGDGAVALPAVQPEAAAARARSPNGSRTSSAAEAIAFDAAALRADRARRRRARCATRCRCSTRRSRSAAAKSGKPACARCSASSTASYLYRIVDALLAGDGAALLAEADALAARGHGVRRGARRARVALPSDCRRPGRARARRPATMRSASPHTRPRFTPEAVQLAYQICAQGRADLALAPDEATGFSMTLLRLLAFEPAGDAERRRAPWRIARRAAAAKPRHGRRHRAATHRAGRHGSRVAARAGACARRRRAAVAPRKRASGGPAACRRTGSRRRWTRAAAARRRRPHGRRSSRPAS